MPPSNSAFLPPPTLLRPSPLPSFIPAVSPPRRPRPYPLTARFNADAATHGKKKRGRKSGHDIAHARNSRSRQVRPRRPVVAKWGGVVLAESTEYEFLDGRFYFPGESVSWEYMEETSRTRQHNPVGLAQFYDIVVKRGGNVAKNRSAMLRFAELKKPWQVMSGYSCFWKGVKVFSRKDDGREDVKRLLTAGIEEKLGQNGEEIGKTTRVSVGVPVEVGQGSGAGAEGEAQMRALRDAELVASLSCS